MKKLCLILVLAVVLLVSGVASAKYTPPSFKSKEPNGFRGLEWGTNINTIDGMKPIRDVEKKMIDYAKHTIGMSMGGDEEYESKLLKIIDGGEMTKIRIRDGDELQIGGAKLDCIIYYFWDDKLEAVLITTEDYTDQEMLKEAAFQAFGEPYRPLYELKDIYHWWGEKTNIFLIKSQFQGSVFCLFSVEVNEQREAYELEQAKKGAQENF